jgi:hypothetical protein
MKQNLEQHKVEFQEAVKDFHQRLQEDLKLALKKVSKIEDPQQLKQFKFNVAFPENHEEDYRQVIEMLEMSVDETIQLDTRTFKAYVKNEWEWKMRFKSLTEVYKTAGSSLSL